MRHAQSRSATRGWFRTLFLLLATAATCLPVQAKLDVTAQGLFETATVVVTSSDALQHGASGTLSVSERGANQYREALPFSQVDRHSLSTSLFHLKPATAYDLLVAVPGHDPVRASVTTARAFRLPRRRCTLTLQADANVTAAIGLLAPRIGKETLQVCLSPGSYPPFAVNGVIANAQHPLIIRALDPTAKPVIDGGRKAETLIDLNTSANVWLNGLDLRNMAPGGARGGIGIRLDTCRGVVVRNSVITGDGRWGILLNRCFQFPAGHGVEDDFNLIEGNTITGLYNAIQFDNNDYVEGNAVGMGLVVRANRVEGGYDNFRHCGDEDAALAISERVDHYFRLTGESGTQTALNIDVYDNVIGSADDDNVEVDGVCANYKFFRNQIAGDAWNTVSIAPLAPGPNYFIGNVMGVVSPEQSLIKFNTGGDGEHNGPTRNVFFFHNTMVRVGSGAALNLWWGHNEHSVPIKNIEFKNNIFMSIDDDQFTDVEIGGSHIENPRFDGNHWHAAGRRGGWFEWFHNYDDRLLAGFEDFVEVTGQEQNGSTGDPKLYKSLRPTEGSPVIDSGVRIPGVNDHFKGKGPDKGASDVFHRASMLAIPNQADSTPPSPRTAGLPATLNDANPAQQVTVSVSKPRDSTRARVFLSAEGADGREEGRMSINGNKRFALFTSHAEASNSDTTRRLGYETTATWWRDGDNVITFEHTASDSFTVHGIEVEFLP